MVWNDIDRYILNWFQFYKFYDKAWVKKYYYSIFWSLFCFLLLWATALLSGSAWRSLRMMVLNMVGAVYSLTKVNLSMIVKKLILTEQLIPTSCSFLTIRLCFERQKNSSKGPKQGLSTHNNPVSFLIQ